MKQFYSSKTKAGSTARSGFSGRGVGQFVLRSVICVVLLQFSLSDAKAQNPTIQTLFQNPWVQVAAATSDSLMMFPRVYGFDMSNGGVLTKKTILSYQRNSDAVQTIMKNTYMGAYNEPTTWTAPSPTRTEAYGSMDLAGPIRRNNDGSLYSLSFFWGAGTSNPTSLVYWTSTDNGNTWTRNSSGHISFPAGVHVGGFRFHRGIIQDADGTLYAPAHGQVQNANGTYTIYRLMLMKSTDYGANWFWVSDIQYTSNLNYMEGTIVRCKDGSILAVMRSDPYALKYQRSTNNGASWGSVTYVPNLPAHQGVDPILEMLPNGILMLGYGNNLYSTPPYARNCMIAFSEDGNGSSWTKVTTTFTSGATPSLANKNRSTGYTSLLTLRGNRFMQFSDRGDWRYYGTDQTPSPNPQSVWSKTMELETSYKNRIDLKSKFPAGQVAITTDMTNVNTTHPMEGVAGAFDGSIYFWNGAFKNGTSGYYTVDLLQDTRLKALAICLQKGVQQSATIEYMEDGGTTWSSLKTYSGVTHHTVDYFTFPAEINARYVKVTVNGSASMVGINEFVLFSSADTYEDYAYGAVPYGYTPSDATTPGFFVTEGVVPTPSGYQSKRALFMQDLDANNKSLRKSGYAASATKTFEFKLRTKAFATSGGAIQFHLNSGTTTVFHMAVFSSGAIAYYNGTWHALPGTPVPLDTWKSIKVVANAASTAAIYVDGVLIGNAAKETASATTIDGFTFGSGGSSITGDKALFDDVLLYNTTITLALGKQEASTSAIADAAAGLNATELDKPFSFVVSPNPASNVLKLDISHPSQDKISVRIVNMSGLEVKKLDYSVSGKSSLIEIPVGDVVPGMYVVQATQNNVVISTKVIIH